MSERIAGKVIGSSSIAKENLSDYDLMVLSFNAIKIQYKALKFIDLRQSVNGLEWSLTELGEQEMFNLSAVKKAIS
jgi:hypothetical protein